MQTAPDFRPLYAQVRDLIVDGIAAGEWAPGDALPSEPRLAERFRVSQGTVRKALEDLALQHVVVRRQGKGTFVASYTPDRALFQFFHLVDSHGERALPDSRVISCREGRATRQEQIALALEPGDAVVRISRVRSLGGTPLIAERIAAPASIFPGLAHTRPEMVPNTLYAHYEQRFGVAVTDAEERLRAVGAEAFDARLLGVAPDTPLLEIERVAFTHGARAVEWRVSRCNTRSHHYRVHLS